MSQNNPYIIVHSNENLSIYNNYEFTAFGALLCGKLAHLGNLPPRTCLASAEKLSYHRAQSLKQGKPPRIV